MARPEERNVPEGAPPHRRAAPQELLFRTRKATGTTRRQRLQEADARLDELRLYLRLAHLLALARSSPAPAVKNIFDRRYAAVGSEQRVK